MSICVRVSGNQFTFPPLCVVCQQPASASYTIEKVIAQGRSSSLLRIPVPMCADHAAQANSHVQTERAAERVAAVLGTAAGLACAAGLLLYWNATGQGNLWLNVMVATFIGPAMGFTLWAILAFYVAPLFANRAIRQLRAAVRIKRIYSWGLELEFQNPAAAAAFAQINPLQG